MCRLQEAGRVVRGIAPPAMHRSQPVIYRAPWTNVGQHTGWQNVVQHYAAAASMTHDFPSPPAAPSPFTTVSAPRPAPPAHRQDYLSGAPAVAPRLDKLQILIAWLSSFADNILITHGTRRDTWENIVRKHNDTKPGVKKVAYRQRYCSCTSINSYLP